MCVLSESEFAMMQPQAGGDGGVAPAGAIEQRHLDAVAVVAAAVALVDTALDAGVRLHEHLRVRARLLTRNALPRLLLLLYTAYTRFADQSCQCCAPGTPRTLRTREHQLSNAIA